jgi:hypothetical protein
MRAPRLPISNQGNAHGEELDPDFLLLGNHQEVPFDRHGEI